MNKIKWSFYDFDKTVYEIFNSKIFLDAANKIGNGVNYFQAIQNNVFESLCAKLLKGEVKNILHVTKVAIRTDGVDHRIKRLINYIFLKKHATLFDENSLIFFSENFVPHILNDFIKISTSLNKTFSTVFVTTDYRAYRFMQKNGDTKTKYHLIVNFEQKNKQYKLIKKAHKSFLIQLKNTLQNKTDFYFEIERILFKNIKLLHSFSITFDLFLNQNKPKAIFVGSDGFSVSRILTYTAKSKKIPTYVLQHGLLSGFNGYLPLVADKILVWSEFDKTFFKEHNVEESRVVVAGVPRFKKTEFKIADQHITQNNILFITSPTSNTEASHQIEVGINIYKKLVQNNTDLNFSIRPHPYSLQYSVSYLKKKYPDLIYNQKIIIDKQNFDVSLANADLIVFAEISTTLFEAIICNKFCVLLELKNDPSYNIIDLYKIKRQTYCEVIEMIEQPEKILAYKEYLNKYKNILNIENTFNLIEAEINSI